MIDFMLTTEKKYHPKHVELALTHNETWKVKGKLQCKTFSMLQHDELSSTKVSLQ